MEQRRVVYRLPKPSPENLKVAVAWRQGDKSAVLAVLIGVVRQTLPGLAH